MLLGPYLMIGSPNGGSKKVAPTSLHCSMCVRMARVISSLDSVFALNTQLFLSFYISHGTIRSKDLTPRLCACGERLIIF